jgi:hypothetical protein
MTEQQLRIALTRLAEAAGQYQDGRAESSDEVNAERWRALYDRTYEAWALLRPVSVGEESA